LISRNKFPHNLSDDNIMQISGVNL
jgi:hypothetical protein